MAQIITEDELNNILKSAPGKYFFHRVEDGEVILTFTSPITITDPGEEDLLGRIWDPKVTDENGNPLLDINNQPRQKWSKVEAECLINGVKHVYSFGGKQSSSLRKLLEKMNENDITNETLPGTKWSITRVGKWDWIIQYLGREEKKQSTKSNSNIDKIRKSIEELKKDNPSASDGITKNEFLQTISFLAGIKPVDIISVWDDLVDNGIIKVDGDKIYL